MEHIIEVKPAASGSPNKVMKAIIWTAIGALIASALICVWWVLTGSQTGLVTKAFLSVALLTGFALATIWDVKQSVKRPEWLNLVSIIGWILVLLAGAVKIWQPVTTSGYYFGDGLEYVLRFVDFVFILVIIRLAILHFGLYYRSLIAHFTLFNKTTGFVTLGLVALLAGLLVAPLMTTDDSIFPDLYWRVTVAVAILAAVGTVLVPLVNTLTIPRQVAPVPASIPPQVGEKLPWPTFNDGVTPLPVLPNGLPDFQATYPAPSYVSSPEGAYNAPQLPQDVPETTNEVTGGTEETKLSQ